MRAGLNAGEAEHAIAVVAEVGWVRSQGAASRCQAFAIGWPPFEAGVAAAAAAASAGMGSQLQDREFGEEPVHASDGAEVTAPEPLFEDQ